MPSYCRLIDCSRNYTSPFTLRFVTSILNVSLLERCNERMFEDPNMQQNMLEGDYRSVPADMLSPSVLNAIIQRMT